PLYFVNFEVKDGHLNLPHLYSFPSQVGQRETSVEDPGGNAEYCLDFLVPVAGFLCRLCHKFYSSDSATRLTHCKSRMHFDNLQVRRKAEEEREGGRKRNKKEQKGKEREGGRKEGKKEKKKGKKEKGNFETGKTI
uniref:Matrin-type domain-containing protein n=1 Tax=Naja naja TaxID=35670 RepID=A0A8C6YDR0_NAJNA